LKVKRTTSSAKAILLIFGLLFLVLGFLFRLPGDENALFGSVCLSLFGFLYILNALTEMVYSRLEKAFGSSTMGAREHYKKLATHEKCLFVFLALSGTGVVCVGIRLAYPSDIPLLVFFGVVGLAIIYGGSLYSMYCRLRRIFISAESIAERKQERNPGA